MISKDVLEILGLIIQVLLAIFALWYTIETRNLRRHSMKQLAVLQRQHLVAVSPFLLVGLRPKAELVKELETEPAKVLNVSADQVEETAKRELSRLRAHDGNLYFCNISNPTSKIALQVDAFVYDSSTKNFTTSGSTIVVVAEKEDQQLVVGAGPLSQQEAIDAAQSEYPELGSKAAELLNYNSRSYLLVLFRDIEQAGYAIKREFEMDSDQECGMFTSRLHAL
ncbi:MAG: hypothetical protein RKO25_07445 [Candidatus Contendobacter sp.]|nr:hypothetical protein [Candidatus Contendobacter sp.]